MSRAPTTHRVTSELEFVALIDETAAQALTIRQTGQSRYMLSLISDACKVEYLLGASDGRPSRFSSRKAAVIKALGFGVSIIDFAKLPT